MTRDKIVAAIGDAVAAMSWWEVAAVVLALGYLILAMRENSLCWYTAFISTSIYIFLFWDVSLLMESALQIFYLVMAVYGWWQWRSGGNEQTLRIHRWSFLRHIVVIAAVGILTLGFGYILQTSTHAALPYLDSFTTWGAVVTTYMVTRKVLENWIYWIVIDGVSVYLYIDRELYLTALLFVLYVVLVVIGFFQWRLIYNRENAVTSTP